ncbi:Protein arginine N-methyltransferase [Lachnellula occidentalis]|uniref:Protein arginine N-methyltransferase n=1 Tax=Lachnellula occidentalis TaxID=215460 RepID=A0A8H8UI81_9HELO|nr:Protein arginine N-methyltransferase [Lachnellula occidentalis]
MTTSQSLIAEVEPPSPLEDSLPTFYIGHHESKRPLPVTEFVLRQAQDAGYDMLTSPITSPHFHSRVLTLVSSYLVELSRLEASDDLNTTSSIPPAPIIPPLTPFDTPMTPSDTLSQLIGYCSPWIDLCSSDPFISNISRQVLNIEIAYASFCGVGNIIIPGPRNYSSGSTDNNGIIQYARAIQEALTIGSYIQMAIHVPMYGQEEVKDMTGDLQPFARDYQSPGESKESKDIDLFETWDAWNFVRSPPWLLLSDVGPVPGLDDPVRLSATADGFPPSSAVADASRSVSPSPTPTPAEATAASKEAPKSKPKQKDPAAHLIYMRYLQRHQPTRTALEKFGSGYQDYLQAPLQPLTDNLESVTYEVFEKDPVKYDWYERAIAQALSDWTKQNKPTSSSNGAVVIAVAGSGRGPLVTRALIASAMTGVPVEVWAVEKNPNAYVLLQRHNDMDWGGVVNVVKSDMRAWKGPLLNPTTTTSPASSYGKVDILVSELLGSFADNELSPECLDGVQHVLAPQFGISIPSSYTAHLTPILAPRLHADISHRAVTDTTATETPYVVMLHAIDYLATTVPDHPRIQQVWEFVHPLPESTLAIAEARRGGGVSGGGGGSMSGGDGANEHNARYSRMKFICRDRGVVNGLAGYFEAVLYDGGVEGKVELSTRPDTIDEKSKDMISWFPIFFPLKNPLYYPDDSELEVSIWRQTDDRKVWYEWMVEAFVMVGPEKRMRLGMSEVGSSRKVGCLM